MQYGSIMQLVSQVNIILVLKISLNESECLSDPDLPKLDIPVGILPIGSGNLLSMKLNMSHDVQSCVVNLILGNKRKIDLISCHDLDRQSKFVRVAALVITASNFNTAAGQLEKFRFLGPFRYLLFIVIFIFRVKSVPYESFKTRRKTSYQPSQSFDDVDEIDGRLGEPDGVGFDDAKSNQLDATSDWTEMTGVDKSLVGTIMVSKHEMMWPIKGVTNSHPGPRLSDGVAMSRIAKTSKFSRIFKFLFIWYTDICQSSGSKMPHTTYSWMSEFEIEAKETLPFQFDGENVSIRHVYGKVHRAVVDAYGTGAIRGHPEPFSRQSIWDVRWLLIKVFSMLIGGMVLVGFLIRFVWNLFV